MNKLNPFVSVIIPVFKDWHKLQICLDHLSEQVIGSWTFEILIINNLPNDTLPKNFRLPANSRILDQPLPGSYAARNLGVQVAKSQIIAFTDSDCKPHKNWLSNGLDYFKKGADLVGGKIELFKEEFGNQLVFEFEKRFAFDQQSNVVLYGQSVTANLFVSKKVFDKIGYFSNDFLSGQDIIWTKKATNAGFRMVFGRDVVIKHPARKSINSLFKKKRRTAGGLFELKVKKMTINQSIVFFLKLLRPPVTIFVKNPDPFLKNIQFFMIKWLREWIGVKELVCLKFFSKKPERF